MVVDICILRPIWDVKAENIFSDDGTDDMFKLPAGQFCGAVLFPVQLQQESCRSVPV
jgi:hypothetical protein